MTISGTVVSLGSSGVLVVGSSSTTLSPLPTQSSIFIVGGKSFIAYPTAFPLAGKTLSAGGPGVVLSGTPISLGASGKLVIGSSTATLADDHAQSESAAATFTVGGKSFVAHPTGFAIVGDPEGVDGGMFSGVAAAAAPPVDPTAGSTPNNGASAGAGADADGLGTAVFTINGQLFTVEGDGKVEVGGATLTRGRAATTVAGGERVSAGLRGLIVGNETMGLWPSGVASGTGAGQPVSGAKLGGARLSNVLWAGVVVVVAGVIDIR